MSTPCERLGYKVGDKFRVTEADIGWGVGQIIELQYDDESPAPLFVGPGCEYHNGQSGESGGYLSLVKVEKIVDNRETSGVESSHQVETDWINWAGGECPVPRGTLVDVKYRCGEERFSLPALEMVPGEDASYSFWKNDGMRMDIVSYRLTQTTKQEITTQENQTMTELKTGDKVVIKKGITNFRYGRSSAMVGAQRNGTELRITDVGGYGENDRILAVLPDGDEYNFTRAELDLVVAESDSEYLVKPQLKAFALDTDKVSADQVNEILSLAVGLGANAVESVYDSECSEEEVEDKYPDLEDSCTYNLDGYEWVGVDTDNETLTCDDLAYFNNNVMTYEEAKIMLTGVKRTGGTVITTYKVEPKLVPFYIEMDSHTAQEINQLLVMAVALGAKVGEAVTDSLLDHDQAKRAFPQLRDAAFYPKSQFSRIGVIKNNLMTYITGPDSYQNNKLTYEEAEVMLTGIKNEEVTQTTQGDTKLKTEKPALKSFYFPIEGVKAEVINNIFKRLIAVGVSLCDTTHDSEQGEAQKVREDFVNIPGTNCEVACFNLAGVSKRGDNFVTWVNDRPNQYDDEAVAMTLEAVLAYVSQLEGKNSGKSKVPTLRQRKVKIVYTNDKGYQLKNVIAVDIKSDDGTVNITYKQRKGKVIHNNNVVIPFSELKSVKFVGPKVIGAEYIFKGGKVVQVIQDYTHEAFTHKSH